MPSVKKRLEAYRARAQVSVQRGQEEIMMGRQIAMDMVGRKVFWIQNIYYIYNIYIYILYIYYNIYMYYDILNETNINSLLSFH